MLNAKEAFGYLSHHFHGKGSGKMKTEKRMKKMAEESMMKNMSSTDTPLQMLEKLCERQKESATPYDILTGNKLNPTDLRK
jgi:U4/U6.U5 tri-snRNP-associated protein 1